MLYQQFRPQTFKEVVGQDHIIGPVLNALKSNEYPHSYLLVGSRGLGKTTLARLICKYLNCQNPNEDVCNECENCKAVAEGNFADLIELDAASNRGIDNIRTIIDRVNYAPLHKVKTYIIDEAHMLTREAANAILKVLEEPPQNVVFILATTEEEKILPTIKSRCQLHRYRLISLDLAVLQLQMIAKSLSLEIPLESLKIIGAEAKGSVRDAITLLENIKASNKFEPSEVREQLGQMAGSGIIELVEAMGHKDVVKAFAQIKKLTDESERLDSIASQLELWFQQLLSLSVGVTLDSPYLDKLEDHSKLFTTAELVQFFDSFTKWRTRFLPLSRLTFEVALADFLATKSAPQVEQPSSVAWLTGTKHTNGKVQTEEREPDF